MTQHPSQRVGQKYPTVVCGWCSNEFKNLNAPQGRHPCPQCRSRKVEEIKNA